MEKLLRKIIIIFAVLGLVGFLGNLIVDNPYTHRLIRAGINEKVTTYTYLTVDFKAIKVSLLPLGADLYGFYLAPAATPNQPLSRASHLEIRVSLFSLFMGEPSLSRVAANDLEVIWPPPWNFPGFLKNPGPPDTGPITWPPQVRLPINSMVLKNAQIYFEEPLEKKIPLAPRHLALTTVGLNLDATFDGWDDIEAALNVQAINLALGPTSMLEDTALDARLELKKNTLTANHIRLKGPRIRLDGDMVGDLKTSGSMHILDGLGLKADATVDGDLSILGSFLDLSDTRGPVKGSVEVTAFAPIESNAPAEFKVRGKGKANGTRLAGFKLYDSATAFTITSDKVAFDTIDVMIGDKTVGVGSGHILLNDPIDFDFKVQPDELQLSELLDALGVDFSVFDTAISSPDLRISGQATPFALNVKATGLFTDFSLPTIDYDHSHFPKAPSCRFNFRLAVSLTDLDFGGTEGNCYQPMKRVASEVEAKVAPIKANQTAPPAGSSGASAVELSGHVYFDDKKGIDLAIRSNAIDLEMGHYFAQVPLTGKGTATTRIHGPYDHVLIDIEAALNQTTVRGIALGTVNAKATVDGDKLKWQDVTARPDPTGSGLIEASSGTLFIGEPLVLETRLEAKDLSADTVTKTINTIVGGNKLSFGIDHVKADLKGPLLFPLAMLGKADVTLSQITYDHEILADSVSGSLQSTKQGWHSDNLVAALGDIRLGATVTHKRLIPFNADHAAGSQDLLTSLGLSPDDHVAISLVGYDAKEGAGAKIKVPGKSTKGLPKTIVGPERPEKADVLRPDHLQRLPFAGAALREANITGLIELAGQFEGRTDHLQGAFSGRINKPSVFGSGFSPVNFKGFLTGSKLDIMLDHSGNSLEGRISMDFLADGVPYEWYFNLNRMDLRALGTEVFYKDPRNYAYLSANWQMRGKFTDWWRSTGELNIKDIRANYVQDMAGATHSLQIKQEQPVKLIFAKDGWTFDDDKDLFLTGRNMRLRLSVAGSKPPDAIDIKLDSIIDVGIIQDFVSGIDTATGKIRVEAEIKGPATDPQLSFEITDLKPNPFIAATLKPVTLGLSDVRPPFRNIHMRVIYKDHRLVIDSLEAAKGAGTVSVSGSLNLDPTNNQESRLDITLKDTTMIYQVAFLKSFETQMSGNVSVTGKEFPFRVSGDLNISKARSTKEVDIRNEIINALRKQSFTTTLVAEKPLVIFDLNIAADNSINIHNRNLQTILSASLQVKGTDITPSISGQVEIDKGKFIYKREFQVTRGLVTFDDPVKPDPALDILAVSEVGNYRIYIAINGRASNPTVDLSADPPTREDGSPISKEEILVLLSSGKLPDANRSVGQTQDAATSEALNLIMGQFEEPVEKLFDLTGQTVVRNVYIDTYPSQNKEEFGKPVPRLNLPLDLSEDFDVVLRGDQSTKELSTEYNIHDNITFSSSVKTSKEDATTDANTDKTTKTLIDDAQLDLKFRFSFE